MIVVLWLTGGDGREEEFKVPDHTQPVSVLRKDDDDIKLNKYKASGVTQWLLLMYELHIMDNRNAYHILYYMFQAGWTTCV